MRTIKLMADYQCYPLWEASPGQVGNIDPDTLPLSCDLKTVLLQWAHAYDLTLNHDDPVLSGFRTHEDEIVFKKRGIELGERLRSELGSEFDVKVVV
jgi:hypothetical protein